MPSPRLTEITDEILTALRHVMAQRPGRRQLIHHNGLNAPAFVFAERAAMATAVNAARHRLGLPAVDESEVEACEDEAWGSCG